MDLKERLNDPSNTYLESQPNIRDFKFTKDNNGSKKDSNGSKKDRETCSASAFQCLALETMRDQLNADLALLQQNDFYYQCNYETSTSNLTSTEMVGRVLWNSGYLTRVSVSGSTLKTFCKTATR